MLLELWGVGTFASSRKMAFCQGCKHSKVAAASIWGMGT